MVWYRSFSLVGQGHREHKHRNQTSKETVVIFSYGLVRRHEIKRKGVGHVHFYMAHWLLMRPVVPVTAIAIPELSFRRSRFTVASLLSPACVPCGMAHTRLAVHRVVLAYDLFRPFGRYLSPLFALSLSFHNRRFLVGPKGIFGPYRICDDDPWSRCTPQPKPCDATRETCTARRRSQPHSSSIHAYEVASPHSRTVPGGLDRVGTYSYASTTTTIISPCI
jgi:hypothetical protein